MSRTLSITSTAFAANLFHPVKISGVESVNDLFQYQLILKTPDTDPIDFFKQNSLKLPHASIDLTQWLGQSLLVGIELDGKDIVVAKTVKKGIGKGTRYISGVITSARYLYDQGRSSYYCIELRPFIAPATLHSDYKIYQDLTVIEILDQILEKYTGSIIKRLGLNNTNRYPKRDYQTQYGETDYQFFIRLCSEWGINFWFEHNESGHSLVLADDITGHQKIASKAYQNIAYYPANHKITEEYLHELNITTQMVSGAYASADYDYAQAFASIQANKHLVQPYPDANKGVHVGEKNEQIADIANEVYEYAADVTQAKAGPNQDGNEASAELSLRNKWNLERLQQNHFTASAKGHIRGLATGYTFSLNKHSSKLANIQWTITQSELLIMDLAEESQRRDNGLASLLSIDLSKEQTISSSLLNAASISSQNLLQNNNQQWLVECSLNLIPSNVPIRPNKVQKPKGHLQTAIVVGDEESESVYTDYLGRIKIQFHWDRCGQKDQNASCWVRVNEPWAGNQLGATFTPRINQEVLIDFINGDPDLPVCIGKVNNSDNLPNWELAKNKALSGIRTREFPEGNSNTGRSNHLVFDDTEGKIQTQLKSDHAHSQLSLGDITRIEDNQGRKDARGQGFELRTDDWGAARAAKGMHLTTFSRESAASTHMDAVEAQKLLEEAKDLVSRLSKLAEKHETKATTAETPLKEASQVVKVDLKSDAEDSPKGFSDPILLISGEAGIAHVTPVNTHHYSGHKHNIVAGEDINLNSGHSLLSSSGVDTCFYAQQKMKFVAGQGEIQIKADDNNIDIIADKSVQINAVNNKVQVTAEKEIMIACGGAYIKLSGGNIYLHAPGVIEHKGASHPFGGPKSEQIAGSHRKAGKGELELNHLYANKEGAKSAFYKVIDSLGNIHKGALSSNGNALVKGLPEGCVKAFFENDKIDPTSMMSSLTQNLSWPNNPLMKDMTDKLFSLAKSELLGLLPSEVTKGLDMLNQFQGGGAEAASSSTMDGFGTPTMASSFAGGSQKPVYAAKEHTTETKSGKIKGSTKKPLPDGTVIVGTMG